MVNFEMGPDVFNFKLLQGWKQVVVIIQENAGPLLPLCLLAFLSTLYFKQSYTPLQCEMIKTKDSE